MTITNSLGHPHARTHIQHTYSYLYSRDKTIINECNHLLSTTCYNLVTYCTSYRAYIHYRDGVISKEEMTQYFLGANQSLKRIFKHNFQECSYNIITPTYCDHCKGKLIGYVRQGYKCKGLWYLDWWCSRTDGLISYMILQILSIQTFARILFLQLERIFTV